MPLNFIAMLYPKPDRVARVEEIARQVCESVHEKEPGVLKYQWFRAGGTDKPLIVVWETYLDQAAVDAHTSSPVMAWLVENDKKEENMAAPITVMPLEQFAGWENRS
ncbi:83bf384a-9f5e-4ba6-ae0d-8a33fa3c040d [Thermothielavioides terrestris]|uniref:ABM domain-containing protein n=2 Tax=Thermothielavioides terrestris TaxID=2587410 RepID=G2QW29_THETT|nr:uncharacterized protein THITE_2041120 [Thermothielavioides terrestris NRRL 8126]AEO62200.1 hypothetical protein THITE_2041120 [Thermothielavioides terrestris NRRL 8126]SPQ24993.1 83bf384a-9f5e-4ba6-ae0d-8a33fa3c040d [Thermothielavioides terrestris]